MKQDLNGKVVVITGASSGFGKGAALTFAQLGANLVVAARREQLLDDLVTECEALGCKAVAVPTDVCNPQDIDNLFNAAMTAFGRIDVWVNNAGAAAVGVFTDIPVMESVKVIETDLIGTIYGSYAALTQFRLQGFGTLINIASMIGKVPAPYYAAYAAAKHGVVGLSGALRQELREQKVENIHVCTVMPITMDTPFFEHAANYSGRETVPIPPLDDAEKVIEAIVNLATDPKDEVPVGTGGGSNVVMHNLAAAVSEAMMGKITHKAQMENAPRKAPTPGGLSEPAATGRGVHDPKLKK